MRFVFRAALVALLAGKAALASEPQHNEEDAAKIDEILVTPAPLSHSGDELSVPVNVLDRDHVLGHLGATLGETLGQEAGITTSSFAAGASRPVIRGQDSFRVRILQDGNGTHDVSAVSADHGVPVNPLTARRVEVVRGPAALRYGGGAIAGVVNAITGRVPRAHFDGPAEGDFYVGYDVGSRGRDLAGVVEGSLGPIAYHADGFTRDSDDYDIPTQAGKQRNTDSDGWSGSLGAAAIGQHGRLGVAYSHFENVYGIPPEEGASELSKIDLDSKNWDFEADLYQPISGISELRFRGRYSDYDHAEVVGGNAASTFDNDEWEGRLELLHEEIFGMEGALGFHQRDVEFSAGGEASELLAPSQTNLFAVYLYEDIDVSDRFGLHLGLRIESVDVEGTPADGRRRDLSFSPFSIGAGLLFDATENIALGLNLSATQRAPESLELFAAGPHEADSTFQVGNPLFDEETSLTADLLVRGDFGRFAFEGSLFYTGYRDFIFGRDTGRTCDESGTCMAGAGLELQELFYTQEDAKFFGAELQGSLEVAECLGGVFGIDGQFDFVRARLERSGNVPRISPMRYGGGIYFSHDRLRARLGFLHREDQHDTARFETSTSGFTTLDGSVSIRLVDGALPVDLVLGGRNLTNAKGRNHVSFNKDAVVLPGRSGRLGINLAFR